MPLTFLDKCFYLFKLGFCCFERHRCRFERYRWCCRARETRATILPLSVVWKKTKSLAIKLLSFMTVYMVSIRFKFKFLSATFLLKEAEKTTSAFVFKNLVRILLQALWHASITLVVWIAGNNWTPWMAQGCASLFGHREHRQHVTHKDLRRSPLQAV